ncbi:hypothetical protein CUU54_09190 [Pectobacterium polaris]|nr:hypothetical protein [Pectobacterium polaris]PWD59311.1 hypothetical protein DF209_11590 [Pectobacterium polaris]
MSFKLLCRLVPVHANARRARAGSVFSCKPMIRRLISIKIDRLILSMKNYINKYSENAKYSLYLADELAWFLSFQLGEM